MAAGRYRAVLFYNWNLLCLSTHYVSKDIMDSDRAASRIQEGLIHKCMLKTAAATRYVQQDMYKRKLLSQELGMVNFGSLQEMYALLVL